MKNYKEYAQAFFDNDATREVIEDLNEVDAYYLYERAQSLIDEVEYGCSIDYESMNKVEGELIMLLSAIKDVTLELDLTLTPTYSEEKILRRTR